jgi:hypothetical protein
VARSIAQQIIDTLMARAQAIRLASGYQTDAGARVYHMRPSLAAGDLPCVNFWPGNQQAVAISGASERVRWERPINIEAIVPATPDSCGQLGEALAADLQQALLDVDDLRVNGQAISLQPTEVQVVLREDGGLTVGAILSITVNFVTGYGDPYT